MLLFFVFLIVYQGQGWLPMIRVQYVILRFQTFKTAWLAY